MNKTITSLAEFSRPQKRRYILSVVLAIFGEVSGILPYFAAAKIISGLIRFQVGLKYCLIWCATPMRNCEKIWRGVQTNVDRVSLTLFSPPNFISKLQEISKI